MWIRKGRKYLFFKFFMFKPCPELQHFFQSITEHQTCCREVEW